MPVIDSQTQRFDVLVRGKGLWKTASRLSSSSWPGFGDRLRIFSDWNKINSRANRDLCIVIWREDLLDRTEFAMARRSHTAGEKRFLVLPDESPSESLLERIFDLKIRSIDRIHTPELEADTFDTFLRRFLCALALWPDEPMIADAWLEKDNFVLFAPTFKRLKVPLASIPGMRNASHEELMSFDINDEGEFIHWPGRDVHVGWPQFEQAIDPRAKLRAQQKSEAFNKRYGQAIRSVRESAALVQSGIDGLDARTVRRIEQGATPATANALIKLATAHGMEIDTYLSTLASALSKTCR